MSTIFHTALVLAGLAASVTAHTSVKNVTIGGNKFEGYRTEDINTPVPSGSPAWRTDQRWEYGPVFGKDVSNPDVICHKIAEPSPNTVEAPAGSSVTFEWYHEGKCREGESGWDCSHHGWTTTYLAACNGDCSKVDKEALDFFKIDELVMLGYPQGSPYAKGEAPNAYTGKWATDEIMYGDNTHTIKIPANIRNGNYVMRTEVASIHNNGWQETQIWPQCFNIKITGGDDSAPMDCETSKGTQIYKSNGQEELMNHNIYWHEPNKMFTKAPGPKLCFAQAKASTKTRRHAKDMVM